MTSSFRLANRTDGGTSSPEKIRREWQDFQPWLAKMRKEEEVKRQTDLEELKKTNQRRIKTQGSHSDTISAIEAGFQKEKKALRDRMEDRVNSRAKQEWEAQLQRANLKMEQWTDITWEENAAVAAVMWGANNEYEDSIAADLSDEAETYISSSTTPTPSVSTRGPQQWTPPDIFRGADLPPPNANNARDSFNQNGDMTPTARWSPPSAQLNAGQGVATPAQTMAEEWLTQNRGTEQAPKNRPRVMAPHTRVVPNGIKNEPLLATPHQLTEDGPTDQETGQKAPANQKVLQYRQWKPPEAEQSNSPTVPAQQKASVQPKTSAQPKASAQPNVLNKQNARTVSNTSVQSNAQVAAPRIRPVELAPVSPEPIESILESNLRKQIEECYRPMFNDAQECYQKALRQASDDEARERLVKDQTNVLAKIRRIADEMYLVKLQLATIQSTEQKQEISQPKASPYATVDNRSMSSSQADGQRRGPNATPPAPLTPPQTPHAATRYIGPILTDDEEEVLFDDVSIAIRNQKIIEFHEKAAVLDISVAERLRESKDKTNKREVGRILTRHQQEVEELQKTKEKERKDATEAERRRRRAEIEDSRYRELSGQGDGYHQHTNQTARSSSSQQKGKYDQSWLPDMQTNINSTRRVQTTNGASKGRPQGVAKQENRYPADSHGLFSMDHADRREKGKATGGPHFGSRQSSKITPLAPTVGLPEMDSGDDEENGQPIVLNSDDDESFVPVPNVDEYKQVRFTPSVLADNSTNFRNIGQRPAFDLDGSGSYRPTPSGSGSGKGPAARVMTKPVKPARMGLEENREKKMEIWYPK